jgi:hypothetical protein
VAEDSGISSQFRSHLISLSRKNCIIKLWNNKLDQNIRGDFLPFHDLLPVALRINLGILAFFDIFAPVLNKYNI